MGLKKDIDFQKIVIFTGSGISAESGLKTFRDSSDGLWNNHKVEDVATVRGWENNPKLVLDFYNTLRRDVYAAEPNAAHLAIAELENRYKVVVITQNVDDLHERAGSTNVIHVHGFLLQSRSSEDKSLVYDLNGKDIKLGDVCELGSQLRPNVIWFGESVGNMIDCKQHLDTAGKVLVVGTSLSVFPAADILRRARGRAEKILVCPEMDKSNIPYGFKWYSEKAGVKVPELVNDWLN